MISIVGPTTIPLSLICLAALSLTQPYPFNPLLRTTCEMRGRREEATEMEVVEGRTRTTHYAKPELAKARLSAVLWRHKDESRAGAAAGAIGHDGGEQET